MKRFGAWLVAVWLCMPAAAAPPADGAAHRTRKTAQAARGTEAARKKPVTPTKTARGRAAPTKRDAPEPTPTGDAQKDQATQTAERDRLTARIATLKQQIAAGERSRSGAAAALIRAERSLNDVNRRLEALAARQRAGRDLVSNLERQRAATAGQIVSAEADVVRMQTARYRNRLQDPLMAYLDGANPNEAARTDAYLGYAVRARAAEVDAFQARGADLDTRRQRADDENRVLAQQADAQQTARDALASDQAARRLALDELSRKLVEQRSAASALEADEKRLSRVVERLQKILEKQAAEERAKREAARKLAERRAEQQASRKDRSGARTPSRPKEPSPVPRDEPVDDGSGAAFARLRGQLALPVRGSIAGRFGTARGNGGATWKGVFVRTEAGAEVHAVAAGRVVFADELRGFGNLLIVDHGNQYLSIYGNNETLLKRSGDRVVAGDAISRAGNSSGDDQTGLYFELRFRGQPFDPLRWIGGR